ncbi:radical SAM protein [Wolbachia endosymbiont of Folsomia candida]|uniref:radical SAM protein n=1 Tax=Wolbachia endosymbiont of Folsomia candida TaxID=169402 RepID=UPI000ACE04A4|nr:radical SAM protein [Wolbachia endosymbiont of Folsomia candida]
MKAGVILKTVERCNINCTYCYYFNKADQSWRNRKPQISMEMVDRFNDFISQGVNDLGVTDLLVEFHGGEPLLQKKHHFIQMCQKIQTTAKQLNLNSIKFALQTNGMLIDIEWIKIFKEYDVGIGISLDGTKALNDVYRLDKKGRSTYESVVTKIRLCQENEYPFGLLSVINPEANGADVYNHFTKELKLRHFDLLLPDANYGSLPIYPPEKYGKFMVEVFDEWIKENSDNPKVFIRYCLNALELFYGNYSRVEGFGKRSPFVLPLICVSNNGDLGPLDDLRTCVPHKFIEYNISNTSWAEFLSDKFFSNFLADMENRPDECKQCCYENVCGGGTYGHRFNPSSASFNNPSVYCEGLKIFWQRIVQFLLMHGFSKEKMKQVLLVNQ